MTRWLYRGLSWLVNYLGAENIFLFVLLLLAMGSLVEGISATTRELNSPELLHLAQNGILLAAVLALWRWRGWMAGIAFALGCGLAFIQFSKLSDRFFAWLLASSTVETMHIPALDFTTPAATTAYQRLLAGLGTIFNRLGDWLSTTLAGQASFDPLMVNLLWSLALWGVAVWAGWLVMRHRRPAPALLPAVGLLAFLLAYTKSPPNPLIALLAYAILMQVTAQYLRRLHLWTARKWEVPEIRLELGFAGIALAASLGVFALLAPSISVQEIEKSLRELITGEQEGESPIARSLGLQSRSGGIPGGSTLAGYRQGGLPNTHLIGGSPELSRQVVMQVHVAGFEPFNPVSPLPPGIQPDTPPRYYWRYATYDFYNGRGWNTGNTTEQIFPPNKPILLAAAGEYPLYKSISLDIDLAADRYGLLVAAGQLLAVNRETIVAWRSTGDMFAAQVEAEQYTVSSLVPDFTADKLRAAGTDYPDAIRQTYLQLPDALPRRLRDLALQLTAAEPTPYDRAVAIERFLRSYPYTLDIPQPPTGVDIADYFLFELQTGYCDYYATAMVVLSRAAGLPARLAIGYTAGTYDLLTARFTVTRLNAHAWVEIYFTGLGWIPFEPTGGLPPIRREGEIPPPVQTPPPAIPPQSPAAPLPEEMPTAALTPGFIIAAGVALLLIAGFVVWNINRWRERRMLPDVAIQRIYQRLYRHSRALAVTVTPNLTPLEFEERLLDRLSRWSRRQPRLQSSLDAITRQVEALTDLYIQSLYTPLPLTEEDKITALKTWSDLRPRLIRARFWRWRNI